MRLLIDTHIFLWSVLEPERLSRKVAKALQDAENETWFSPISTWEIVVLWKKRRISLVPDAHSWLSETFSRVSFQEAPVTHEVAMATHSISLAHRDPADHLLAATARVFDLTLVTSDANLIAGKGYSVLANR